MTTPPASARTLPRRILVRGVNWLGDAVMTTPALQSLRKAQPDAHLTLLVQEKLADLWENHPSLDAIITFSRDESPWALARRLRAQSFHTALVLPNSPRSALEGWLARIPQRIGYRRPWCSWLLTQPIAPRPGKAHMPRRSAAEVKRLTQLPTTVPPPAATPAQNRTIHQIYDYLHLAGVLGAKSEPTAPKLEINPAEVQQAEQLFVSAWRAEQKATSTVSAVTVLGLNPGAEYGPAKRWSAENFAAVAREVSRKLENCVWLVFGGARDWPLGEEISKLAGGGVLNLAGRTSLRQLMALLKLCRVVLTNDTGPMHVAAALGTPVVVPFGSTSPELTGPGLPGDSRHHLIKAGVPCSPCFRRECPIDFRCMTGISPRRVVEGVLQAVGQE